MLPLKDMYPVICTQLKNQSKQQGREEITLVEVQDAFAWEFGMMNRKTVDPHIARMVRMGFLENTNGGKTFRLTGGQGKNGKKA